MTSTKPNFELHEACNKDVCLEIEQTSVVEKLSRYPGDVSVYWQLDPDTVADTWFFEFKNEVEFVTGRRSFDE